MAKTIDELESELGRLQTIVNDMELTRGANQKDLGDLREEIIKLQQIVAKHDLTDGEERIIKKKIRKLKQKNIFDIFTPDEYEEVDIDDSQQDGE